MAQELRGKPVADALCEALAPRIDALKARGIVPALATVRVGEHDDDISYERAATKRCESLGIATRNITLPATCTQDDVLAVIDDINNDASIHGCLLLRPLPDYVDETILCEALHPSKDVDGITPESLLGIFANQPLGFAPCTAQACIEVLKHYAVSLEGARVVVVGRSLVVGKPVSMMLLAENATVEICHSYTRNIEDECKQADIIIVAVGRANTLGPDAVLPHQTVLDVGINWDEKAQKLVGDVSYDQVQPIVDKISPVPGGVGSVTTAVLASHVVIAAERLACT